MKKIVMALACAALVMGMAACKKSNADLIKEYKKVATELVEAANDRDAAKAAKVSKEFEKLKNELQEANLTEEEQMEIAQITLETLGGLGM